MLLGDKFGGAIIAWTGSAVPDARVTMWLCLVAFDPPLNAQLAALASWDADHLQDTVTGGEGKYAVWNERGGQAANPKRIRGGGPT